MFRDREDAAHQLAAAMCDFTLRNPLVLAIPRGGVVIGAVLARELGAEFDVVLSRKLPAPGQPELAIGAISEKGQVHLNRRAVEAIGVTEQYLRHERQHQLAEIARRKQLYRLERREATISGRTIIVTDDGIATGSTMMAALQTVRPQRPAQLIVAVPVAPYDRLAAFDECCDSVICLHSPADFWAVGQFYEDFPTIEDVAVLEVLREYAPQRA
jgi:putative phosphoribosyl transferase